MAPLMTLDEYLAIPYILVVESVQSCRSSKGLPVLVFLTRIWSFGPGLL